MSNLLTREQFREAVFKRDNHKCVFCDSPAVDAHHIIERRLFSDGGYYFDNGISVCRTHHIECEMTTITVEQAREAANIKTKILPEHLYPDEMYDKWGNPILPNGQRLRGELFWDENVQKILLAGSILDQFTHYVKYPRTLHLPWSPGIHDDDRMHKTIEQWKGREVVVGLKMDGENTSCYRDYIHARSIDSPNHPSRNWVKGHWARFSGDIPEGWRICGENMYAEHSIHYTDLTSYFIGFGVWNDRNICLSWDETLEWFELLGIEPNKTLYEGPFDENLIRTLSNKLDLSRDEGYVMRVRDSFSYSEYRKYVGKFVRKGHIQTAKHWMHGQAIVPNKLKEGANPWA